MRHPSSTSSLGILVATWAFAASAFGQELPAGFDATDPVAVQAFAKALRAPQTGPASAGGGVGNVLTVAAKGAKFKTISAALASITSASATNQFVIQVGPGKYVEHVVMKPYVDLVGSGRSVTRLEATGGTTPETAAVVRAADFSQIRSLSIVHNGGGPYAVGIYSGSTGGVDLDDVLVFAQGGTTETYGIFSHASTFLDLSDVTVNSGGAAPATGIHVPAAGVMVLLERSSSTSSPATGPALYKLGSGLVFLIDSSLSGKTGLALFGGPTTFVFGSRISGPTAIRCAGCTGLAYFSHVQGSGSPSRGLDASQGVFQIIGGFVIGSGASIFAGPGTDVRVANTALHGGAAGGGGVFRCAAITDESFQFYATSCP